MDERPIATITSSSLAKWLFLGLPAVTLWGIGGMGALSLLGGLSDGSVNPGVGISASTLGIMWGLIAWFAAGGIILGMGSLVLPIPKRALAFNVFLGFTSMFFSVLT